MRLRQIMEGMQLKDAWLINYYLSVVSCNILHSVSIALL